MNKLETIKNKLKEMNNECKLVGRCSKCSYKDKCFEMFGEYNIPMTFLEAIENIERELVIENIKKELNV